MESLKGIIDRYSFYSEDNGYSVIRLEDKTVVVGNLPKFNEGDEVEFTGNWARHPKYGEQFKVESFSYAYPTSNSGIKQFLGSGMIRGVGLGTADRIVAKFGERTLDIMDNNIERLLEVEGIGKKKLEMIKEGWAEQQGVKSVMIFLQGHGISTAYALKIYKTYGNDAPAIIKDNPYRLIWDIWGIGFKLADEIGKNMGFSSADPLRIKAGIVYILQDVARNGHVFMPEEELIQQCAYALGFELSYSDPIINNLEEEGIVVDDNGKIFLASYYHAERDIEYCIDNLLSESEPVSDYHQALLDRINPLFSDEQKEAVKLSIENNLLIITGGPGTGKTTTLRGIIDVFKEDDKKIMLAAPTGRAAKRMTEVIGMESKTIHRLLEYNPKEDLFYFGQDVPLQTDLLIVDEVSMIDTLLMQSLITAVDKKTTLVLVGDVDQLPSVGAGNVLRDLMDSEKIPTVTLTKIYRQEEESDIILNAHRVNKGEMPAINYLQPKDFIYFEENNNDVIGPKILELCRSTLPKEFGFDPLNDIQIITPMNKYKAGVKDLNKLMQSEINTNAVVYKSGEKIFKLNDKVMQLRNNYDKNVFNGDIGFVMNVDNEKKIMNLTFDGRIVEYNFEELDEVTTAYAITVHKSQGSEYPCVVMPMTTSHYMLLQRNLLYTAITRASKLLILVGQKRAIAMAVRNNRVVHRFTTLFKGKYRG